jgi:ring-1,2-phenylacetyl-CoA epoxidase subunit PaaD
VTGNRTALEVASGVLDPEIPVVTIADLGILRAVEETGDRVTVTITPTYSGCPAMDAIRDDLACALGDAGYPHVEIRTVLAPAWTTDWITSRGRARLAAHGIAPPTGSRAAGARSAGSVRLSLATRCPRCGSLDTLEVSRFGSTACKALFECRACLEPFDSFKVL